MADFTKLTTTAGTPGLMVGEWFSASALVTATASGSFDTRVENDRARPPRHTEPPL